jgi:hypothetical protein
MAPYANVPTKPTNRSNALSERFIFFLLAFRVNRDVPGDGKPLRVYIIHTLRRRLRCLRENTVGTGCSFESAAPHYSLGPSDHGTPLLMRLWGKVLNVIVQEMRRQ